MLESFLKSGILLVPEAREYPREGESNAGIAYTHRIVQRRFCLTEIPDFTGLFNHAKYFGNFHLEFSPENIYALGAVPVLYLPRIQRDTPLWSLQNMASTIIYRICDLQNLCRDIKALDEIAAKKKDNDIVLINRDNSSEEYRLSAGQLKDVLKILYTNIPSIDYILGTIQAMSSLFYPTDMDYKNHFEPLYYFRQREWRIVSGMAIGKSGSDKQKSTHRFDDTLTDDETKTLLSIDAPFFTKEIKYADDKENSILSECRVIRNIIRRKPDNTDEFIPVQNFVKRIIVPKNSLSNAREIAEKCGFDSLKIVDFDSVLYETEKELNYEGTNINNRLNLIHAIRAWTD